MRRLLPLLLSSAVFFSGPGLAFAQTSETSTPASDTAQQQDQPALLVADRIFITPDRKLVAEGNVEAFQGDVKLSAQRVVFDRE